MVTNINNFNKIFSPQQTLLKQQYVFLSYRRMHIWLSSEYSQHQDIALHVRLTQLFLDNSIAFHTYKLCLPVFLMYKTRHYNTWGLDEGRRWVEDAGGGGGLSWWYMFLHWYNYFMNLEVSVISMKEWKARHRWAEKSVKQLHYVQCHQRTHSLTVIGLYGRMKFRPTELDICVHTFSSSWWRMENVRVA